MRLARLRRFARLLVLVLLAGLTMPAFAISFDAVGAPTGVHAYVGDSVHDHAAAATADQVQAASPRHVRPGKALQHCPGCLTAAECALSCLGLGLLPAPTVPVPYSPMAKTWPPSDSRTPVGIRPATELDPPRPVPVR